jgi:hypothetical protein
MKLCKKYNICKSACHHKIPHNEDWGCTAPCERSEGIKMGTCDEEFIVYMKKAIKE